MEEEGVSPKQRPYGQGISFRQLAEESRSIQVSTGQVDSALLLQEMSRVAFQAARQSAHDAITKFEQEHPDIVRLTQLLNEYDHLKAEFAMYELTGIAPMYHEAKQEGHHGSY